MFSKRSAKTDFSSKALPRNASSSWPSLDERLDPKDELVTRPFCAASSTSFWGGLSRSFAIVSAGSHFPIPIQNRSGSAAALSPLIAAGERKNLFHYYAGAAPPLSRLRPVFANRKFFYAQIQVWQVIPVLLFGQISDAIHNRRYAAQVVTGFSFPLPFTLKIGCFGMKTGSGNAGSI